VGTPTRRRDDRRARSGARRCAVHGAAGGWRPLVTPARRLNQQSRPDPERGSGNRQSMTLGLRRGKTTHARLRLVRVAAVLSAGACGAPKRARTGADAVLRPRSAVGQPRRALPCRSRKPDRAITLPQDHLRERVYLARPAEFCSGVVTLRERPVPAGPPGGDSSTHTA
jgi:hypothetical protein